MRKFAVIGAALALLAGTTAAMSVASASAAPKHARHYIEGADDQPSQL